MRNILATLTIFLSLTLTTSSQAAESTGDLEFDNLKQGLFLKLSRFIYQNDIPSDPKQVKACTTAWLLDLYMIGTEATRAAKSTIGEEQWNEKAANAAGEKGWNKVGYVAWSNTPGCYTWDNAQNSEWWIAAQKAARDAALRAASNSLKKGESPEAVGRNAKLAAFRTFSANFDSIFEDSYWTELMAIQSAPSGENLMINQQPFDRFCAQFDNLSDKEDLGLHVLTGMVFEYEK